MKHKPANAWAIVHWNGGIYQDTTCAKKRDAIATFKKMYRVNDKTWRDDRKYGAHRAVKVIVAIA